MFQFNPETTHRLNRQYEQDQRQFASARRLIKGVRGTARPAFGPLMVTLGQQMVAWGNQLQDRGQRDALPVMDTHTRLAG
ncbi:MAG: hypothetical protein SF162_10345 [bacterium]|nr:hypothetical protein [bacterium]